MNKLLFTVLAAGAAAAGYAVLKSLKGNDNDADYDEYDDEFTIGDDDIDLEIAEDAEEAVEEAATEEEAEAAEAAEDAAETVEEAAEEAVEEVED